MEKAWMKVKTGEGDEIDVESAIHGLRFLGDDSSPAIANNYQDNVGQDGSSYINAAFQKNTINANFYLHFGDWYDFKMVKHDIYRLFLNKEIMRIRTDAEPMIVKYVRSGSFDIQPSEPGSHDALFTIPFDNPSGYKFSLKKSDELTPSDLTGLQMGMNLLENVNTTFRFNTTKFSIFNPSDVAIDPYFQRHNLKIMMSFIGKSIQIVNNNNKTEWKYNRESNGKELIVLDGIATYLNGDPASDNTDYGNIILEKGLNSIEVVGASLIDITFSFPFIYFG